MTSKSLYNNIKTLQMEKLFNLEAFRYLSFHKPAGQFGKIHGKHCHIPPKKFSLVHSTLSCPAWDCDNDWEESISKDESN